MFWYNTSIESMFRVTKKFICCAVTFLSFSASALAEDLQFDVAGIHTTFVADKSGPNHDNGLPAHGASFILQGYIYPSGTLDDKGGVNADGSPSIPEKVMGQWTCYGYFIGEGLNAKTGANIVSTQIYNFGDTPGERSLVSEGYELKDIGKWYHRALTGGTGQYSRARGLVKQVLLGYNEHMGPIWRFSIDLQTQN